MAGILDLEVEQGAVFRRVFQWQAGGEPVDLTGFTAKLSVRDKQRPTSTERVAFGIGTGLTLADPFTWRGPWDASTPYVLGDAVTYPEEIDCQPVDIAYVALGPSTGAAPPLAEDAPDANWDVLRSIELEIDGDVSAAWDWEFGFYDLLLWEIAQPSLTPVRLLEGDFRVSEQVTIRA